MGDLVATLLPRIVGSIVGAGAAWAANKLGVELSGETKTQLTTGLVSVMLGVYGAVYAVTHKAISSKVNPTDAAAPSSVQAKANDPNVPQVPASK